MVASWTVLPDLRNADKRSDEGVPMYRAYLVGQLRILYREAEIRIPL